MQFQNQSGVPVASSSQAQVSDESKTRPERKFEARRVLFILLPIIFILFVCGIYLNSCSNPLGGGLAAKGLTRTPTVDHVQLGGNFPTPVVLVATPQKVARSGRDVGLDCWVLADVSQGAVLVPSGSKVLVVGFTFSRSGLVEVSGLGWISQGLVKCDGDVRDLEKPYSIQNTPTLTPSPTVGATVKPVVIVRVVTETPGPATPVPVYTPVPSNGLWLDTAGCVNLSIYGPREVWINGQAATGQGRYCDVHDLKIKW